MNHVTGQTTKLATTPNALQPNPAGGSDAFIAKIVNAIGAGLTGFWDNVEQNCHGPEPRCTLDGDFIVENVGTHDAPKSVLRFYLSDDTTLDPDDPVVDNVIVGHVKAGDARKEELHVLLPPGVDASGAHVIAVVDADNDIPEPNENNNVIVSDAIQWAVGELEPCVDSIVKGLNSGRQRREQWGTE